MQSNRAIKYLVLSGGGAAFPAFAGAINQLEKEPSFSFDNLNAVLGTSVGALTALLISLRCSPEEILTHLSAFNMKNIKEGFDLIRIFRSYGLYRQTKVFDLIKYIIKKKTNRDDPENVTFNDLKQMGFIDLYIVTTKLFLLNKRGVGKMIVFSPEKYPDTSVATAVLVSISASPYFKALKLKKISKTAYRLAHKSEKNVDFFTDGGLSDNYAINFFDKPKYIATCNIPGILKVYNPGTLGLALLTKEQMISDEYKPVKACLPKNNLMKFSEAFINTLLIQFQYQHMNEPGTGERTIEIDRLGVQAFDFGMKNTKINDLIKSGEDAVKRYFSSTIQKNDAISEDLEEAEADTSASSSLSLG